MSIRLPNHGGRIQCNETLVALAQRTIADGNKMGVPVELLRHLKSKTLLKVNSSRAPQDIGHKEVRDTFQLLDEDGSGDLSPVEVAKAMKLLGLKVNLKTAMRGECIIHATPNASSRTSSRSNGGIR